MAKKYNLDTGMEAQLLEFGKEGDERIRQIIVVAHSMKMESLLQDLRDEAFANWKPSKGAIEELQRELYAWLFNPGLANYAHGSSVALLDHVEKHCQRLLIPKRIFGVRTHAKALRNKLGSMYSDRKKWTKGKLEETLDKSLQAARNALVLPDMDFVFGIEHYVRLALLRRTMRFHREHAGTAVADPDTPGATAVTVDKRYWYWVDECLRNMEKEYKTKENISKELKRIWEEDRTDFPLDEDARMAPEGTQRQVWQLDTETTDGLW
ncbi:hypothetical protein CALCODRAFT_482210 [Calocera cornea HHB12733]|uniref:Uncharacterized protein n=1 Tax=Calocera cornea HHB12733 TaxID=1353952 RepID=A0A165GWS8_9BASI|nr:hypothetical protein CALCODRAFT_482210 [Calocera cornea HHB12733]